MVRIYGLLCEVLFSLVFIMYASILYTSYLLYYILAKPCGPPLLFFVIPDKGKGDVLRAETE